jgi:hypothetical protein
VNPVVRFSAGTTANRVFRVIPPLLPLFASVKVNIFFPSAIVDVVTLEQEMMREEVRMISPDVRVLVNENPS